MRRSLILDTTVRLIVDGALVLSVYMLFTGHNQPGGGFVGGLIAAAAFALRYIAGGFDELLAMLRIRPWYLLSAGLLLAAGSTLVPVVFGAAPLDHRSVEWDLELLGKVKLTSATVFDTGVYLIVVGLILMIFEGLGDDSEIGRDPLPGGPT
jgi:multisubunit Na+/H+ antiporter MnhB subunit